MPTFSHEIVVILFFLVVAAMSFNLGAREHDIGSWSYKWRWGAACLVLFLCAAIPAASQHLEFVQIDSTNESDRTLETIVALLFGGALLLLYGTDPTQADKVRAD